MEKMARLRDIQPEDAHFSLICKDLSQVSEYTAPHNQTIFKLKKRALPGPYTFIMEATRETPRRLQHEKRRTIGIRVPDHEVPRLMLAELGEPIMSSTLMLPGDDQPLNDGAEIEARLANRVDALLDGGSCGLEPTTVVDLATWPPVVLRQGRGSLAPFGL